jgi:hypothetical protein
MIVVRRYGRRFFAIYEDGALVAVCCYRKGAETVKKRIEQLVGRLRSLEIIRNLQLEEGLRAAGTRRTTV